MYQNVKSDVKSIAVVKQNRKRRSGLKEINELRKHVKWHLMLNKVKEKSVYWDHLLENVV